MKVNIPLDRTAAVQIARHIGMTELSDDCGLLGTRESMRRAKNQSHLLVTKDSGKEVTQSLVHLDFATLASMPTALRHKLLSAGHVYVIGNYFIYPGLGTVCGKAHYTKPLPDAPASEQQDMHEKYDARRISAADYDTAKTRDCIELAHSDLDLFLDLGAIENIVFNKTAQLRPATRFR